MKKLNLVGEQYNNLLVLSDTGKKSDRRTVWLCKCTCGNTTEVHTNNLRQGTIKSCGCLKNKPITESHKEKLHKANSKPNRNTIAYKRWRSMKQRCKNDPYYANINICVEWKSFDNFFTDMGECPSNTHQLERINNNDGYNKNNCIWVIRAVNCQNRRTTRLTANIVKEARIRYANGELQKDLAKEYNIPQSTLSSALTYKSWKNI